MKLYGNRFLKVLLPPLVVEEINRTLDVKAVWRSYRPMMDHWQQQPEISMMGGFEQRIAGFDLNASPAWVCIEVNFFDDMSDEVVMLLKLKFDLSEEQHYPREPEGGWVL